MKVLYMAIGNFLQETHSGGLLRCLQNYQLLLEYFGEDNVKLCIFTDQMIETVRGNIYNIHMSSSRKERWTTFLRGNSIVTYNNEKKLKQYLKTTDVQVVVFESGLFGYMMRYVPHGVKRVVLMQNIDKYYYKNLVLHGYYGI